MSCISKTLFFDLPPATDHVDNTFEDFSGSDIAMQ